MQNLYKTLRCYRFYDLVLLPVLNPTYLGRRNSAIWSTNSKMTMKLDGDDFTPYTLKSINRYLMGKHSIFNIIEDKDFR